MIGLEKCSIGGKCANIKVPNEISQGDANASSWFRYVFADGSCFGIKLGGIANDKVFRTIDLYFAGDITKQQALNKLVYEKPNIQLCIRSEQMLRQCLTLINSEKL